jgi:heavy metal sensor kinase
MKLSTRLTLYFLSALALLLLGFSVALYWLAAKYLHHQADDRLEAVINTLVAAAEFSSSRVEWEPHERRLSFGRRVVEGQFLWVVYDDQGRRIDGSLLDSEPLAPILRPSSTSGGRASSVVDRQGHPWRLMSRRLEPSHSFAESPPAASGPGGDRATGSGFLEIEAAVSLAGVRESLANLRTLLIVLAAGTWLLAFVAGGRLFRRALRPVTEMAAAAHSIGSEELARRLPAPASGDELEELGRAFNGLLDRLHESHERQRRFTGDASHQLRTPLTAMQGQVDLALRHERSPEEYRRVLSLVKRRTEHLRQIVDALLFLARADAESQRPTFEKIDLDVWLREHLEARPEQPSQSLVKLMVEPDGAHHVHAQASLLGELLDNLLDNASKYSAPGTPVCVRLGRAQDEVSLSVEDHGTGITPQELPHIFDAFYRADQALRQNRTGLGLGLSVAARLARLFGGEIRVESTPGVGSRFTIHLPDADRPSASSLDGQQAVRPPRATDECPAPA